MKFNTTADYSPGQHLVVVEPLSRYLDCIQGDLEAEVKAYVDSLEEDLQVKKPIVEEIKDETETGSSVHPQVCSKQLAGSSTGSTSTNEQIVSPGSMRRVLQKINQDHQGLTKGIEHYRGAVWWPGNVKTLASSC